MRSERVLVMKVAQLRASVDVLLESRYELILRNEFIRDFRCD